MLGWELVLRFEKKHETKKEWEVAYYCFAPVPTTFGARVIGWIRCQYVFGFSSGVLDGTSEGALVWNSVSGSTVFSCRWSGEG